MFGDRDLVEDHFKAFMGSEVVIRDESPDWLRRDLCIAIHSVEERTWLSCIESFADQVGRLGCVHEFELSIGCERTMQLANVVLDRVKVIKSLCVCVQGFDPSPSSTETFIQVLDRSSPLNNLILDRVTDRFVFWSKMLKYAFHNPPVEELGLEVARDFRLVTLLAAIPSKTTPVPRVWLRNCIIDHDLFSLLLSMPIYSLEFVCSSRTRGDFSTVADALASNTTLQDLGFECDEICSSFTEALLNGIANNVTLEGLKMRPLVTVLPFSSVCRAVGRNGSIRKADLTVSTPMDEASMYELAQSPNLEDLTLRVDYNRSGRFSWSAMPSFLRAKQSLKNLRVAGWQEGNDPSDDDFYMIGRSLADNTSLEMLDLDIPSHSQTWKGYAELVSGLGCNTTLGSLTFGTCCNRDTCASPTAFEHAMERNYGLKHVRFTTGVSTPILVETICKLNAAGRKYMLTDSTSREKGIDVLSRVINNLDCLYYHLRENPSLCNLNEYLNDMAATPAKSRKRRRSPDSTSGQCVTWPMRWTFLS